MRIKKRIKTAIKSSLKPIANKFGFVLKNDARVKVKEVNLKNNLLHEFYGVLKDLGFKPNYIVDIGANHGSWTREILRFFPESQISMFEPQKWMKDSINDLLDSNKNISFYPFGVGKVNGTFKFTIVDRDDSCTFTYSEDEAKQKGYKQVDIPVITLNEFIIKEKLSIPDIIKIDAEGIDLEVLEGANSFFGKTEIFMVEAAIGCKRIDNTVKKVIDFMDRHGYTLFDITDINKPFKIKVLWLVELVFVKKGGILEKAEIFKI